MYIQNKYLKTTLLIMVTLYTLSCRSFGSIDTEFYENGVFQHPIITDEGVFKISANLIPKGNLNMQKGFVGSLKGKWKNQYSSETEFRVIPRGIYKLLMKPMIFKDEIYSESEISIEGDNYKFITKKDFFIDGKKEQRETIETGSLIIENNNIYFIEKYSEISLTRVRRYEYYESSRQIKLKEETFEDIRDHICKCHIKMRDRYSDNLRDGVILKETERIEKCSNNSDDKNNVCKNQRIMVKTEFNQSERFIYTKIE